MFGDRGEEQHPGVRAGCLWVTFAGRYRDGQGISLRAAKKEGMSFSLSVFA